MSALATTALTVTLLWTNPSTKATQVVVPANERATPADSLAPSCLPSQQALTDLDSVIVYAWPVNGGYRRRVAAKSVRGREGMPDSIGPLSFPTWTGAHFDVTFKRMGQTARESCVSNRVYFGPVATGVEPIPLPARVVVERWFDVHGRAIDVKRYTGIAFVRWTVRGRFIGTQKVLVWRGEYNPRAIRRPTP